MGTGEAVAIVRGTAVRSETLDSSNGSPLLGAAEADTVAAVIAPRSLFHYLEPLATGPAADSDCTACAMLGRR
jgi:hypothetical protein